MGSVVTCPKCKFTSDATFNECPKCGVIVSKYLQRAADQKGYEAQEAAKKKVAIAGLENANVISIRQRKEWGEILTSFETRNRYDIHDAMGRHLFEAAEEGGSVMTVLTRGFLTSLRPFTMHILSDDGEELFMFKRPFRFYFHEIDICRPNGQVIGRVQRRFSFMRRIYTVMDQNDNEVYTLFGPIFHPWTFNIMDNGEELGKITKKWSGLVKESISDADNFGIAFPKGSNVYQKAILLGAVFLIDFVHFESKQN